MKRIYWRPKHVSRTVLLLVAVLASVGMAAVELLPRRVEQPMLAEKLAAARLSQAAMAALREEHLRRGLPIDPVSDPANTGMIGIAMSPVTSNTGHLAAKQTSTDPNFAAVIVELLRRAGVEKGDRVGVAFSGSFPSLNVSVLAALQTMGLKATIISSASASQWGANNPSFLWVDMEKTLADRGMWAYRSSAASIGGVDDRGLGMPKEGRDNIDEAIERVGLTPLRPKTFAQSLDLRMQVFEREAGEAGYAAYINVGGGATSVGTAIGKRLFRPGLNRRPPAQYEAPDSVMMRMGHAGVPVIHLTQVDALAERYGLAVHPTNTPRVGVGSIYYRNEHDPRKAVAVLLAVLVLLYVFVRSDWGFRMLPQRSSGGRGGQPEPMV